MAERLAMSPDDPEALGWVAEQATLPEAPPPLAPPRLVGRPADLPPAAWHARWLIQRAATATAGERAYHARWLWHLLAPLEPAALPRVSVVIPAHNRADLLREAVASALSQDYPALEVVVADDASDEDLSAALPLTDRRLKLVRLPVNGGVAAARNAALVLANGELVQFLDSDNLLPPTAIRQKIAALAVVPDADLCFSEHRRVTLAGAEEKPLPLPPLGSAVCATQDPRTALLQGYPCPISALLIARHRLDAVGGFDADLRRSEDTMLYRRLGLLPVKAVALDQPLLDRRSVPRSLSSLPDLERHWQLTRLRTLTLLTARPDLWPWTAGRGQLLFREGDLDPLAEDAPPWLRQAAAALLASLDAQLAAPRPTYAPGPLLAVLCDGAGTGRLAGALHERQAPRHAEPTAADLALWRQDSDPARKSAALLPIFAALSKALRRGEAWVPLATLGERPFRAIAHPAKMRWKILAWLARSFGERPARSLARLIG